jgi:hypothetical protein
MFTFNKDFYKNDREPKMTEIEKITTLIRIKKIAEKQIKFMLDSANINYPLPYFLIFFNVKDDKCKIIKMKGKKTVKDYQKENPDFDYLIDLSISNICTRNYIKWWLNSDGNGFGKTNFKGDIFEKNWHIRQIREIPVYDNGTYTPNDNYIIFKKDYDRFTKLTLLSEKIGTKEIEKIRNDKNQIDFLYKIYF